MTRHAETFLAALALSGVLGTAVWGVLAFLNPRNAVIHPLWFYGVAVVLVAMWYATRERP